MITDEKLATLIQRAILQDGRLSQQPIALTVKDRFATLKGTVHSYRRKLIAQEIAASFDDCRAGGNGRPFGKDLVGPTGPAGIGSEWAASK